MIQEKGVKIVKSFINIEKARNIETTDKDRKQLHEDLTQLLHGISRPPALMIPEPHLPTENINIPSYEILCTEPLHDLTNVIQNIIAELPYHIQDKEAQKEFQNFSQTTIGDKNQVKGSDARLYLVKLAKFAANLHEQKKIDKNTIQMIESLVEITNICYSKYECRSPKQILRLYNQCFLFAVTCRIVIGIPSNPKMSKKKFFGSHFHSVTVHLPECLRIFNLRSIVTEQEERIFGDLRRISENTTNRQAQFICDNAMLRFNSQQAAKTDYFTMQESVIQKQAHLLAPRPNSTIPAHIVTKQPTLLQAHLERIPDFLLPGNNIWWHSTNNNLIFHDGPDEPCYRNQGPEMSHFRSSSLKDENTKLKVIWQTIMTRFQENQLILPLRRLKTFDVYGNPFFVTVNKTEENDLEEGIQTPSCDIDTVRADDAIINEPENEEKKDSKSESTEDYIPDIPILQVLRWSVQPSNIDVQGSLLIKPKQLPANNFKKQPTCKKKLFQSEVSNQEIGKY
ncbi:Hypothetical predicted protein [Mytilus galloprovincialis]|uniref:Uncharacterized protein n=1 Tax=Mytilus galloprovincialis TaxID=29158 RepID=A0A8B6E5A4_MYTGA|nr:Hypothetical predicted protein [Mytilus galloprovincialis]